MKFPEQFRWQNAPHGFDTQPGEPHGFFIVPKYLARGRTLKIMATDGKRTEWEHVSVSLAERPELCPSWEEMCLVKMLFWNADECVVQFHPEEKDYVNRHAGCLHLWRCTAGFPTPPVECV